MPMNLVCPSCRGVLPLPDGFQGDAVRCGKCTALIPIPPAAPANSFEPLISTASPSARQSRPNKSSQAAGGTKAMVIMIWGGIAAMTIGTVAFAGWILSNKKEEVVEVNPTAASSRTSPTNTRPTTPTSTKPIKQVDSKSTSADQTIPTKPATNPDPIPTPPPPPEPTPPPPPAPETPPVVIPKATDFPRLVTYLPFDGPVVEDLLIDGVLKQKIGRGMPNGTVIDGIRGKAIRIQFSGRDQGGLDLTDQHPKLDFRIGQNLTLAFWIRYPDPLRDAVIAFGMSGKNDTKLTIGLTDSLGTAFGLEYSHPVTKTQKEYVKLTGTLKNGVTAWNHFAMVRADGKLDAYLNGEKLTGESKLQGGLADFSLVGCGFSMKNAGGTLDLDELAIYQRGLNQTEIKKLAGIAIP